MTATCLRVFAKRQEPAFVPEQHHRALGDEARFRAVLGLGEDLRQLCLVSIRLLEEAHTDLDGENAPHGGIDVSQLECAVIDQGGEVIGVGVAGHIHVQASIQGTESRVATITSKALNDQVADGEGIADDEALEAPLAAQDVVQQEAVAAGGDVVEVHVGAHKGANAGLHGSLEGWEVDVAQ